MKIDFIYILSQIFTILMYVFLAWTYFLKDKRKIVLIDLLSLAANIAAYILLGAWTGMAMCLVALFRNFYILSGRKVQKSTSSAVSPSAFSGLRTTSMFNQFLVSF